MKDVIGVGRRVVLGGGPGEMEVHFRPAKAPGREGMNRRGQRSIGQAGARGFIGENQTRIYHL